MKRVAILGSTGSIGRSTLDVIERHPDRLRVVGLAARSDIETLAGQIRRHRPPLVTVWEEERAQACRRLAGSELVHHGPDGLVRLATHPDVDIVVIATSGRDALVPLVRAIQAGKRVALANKELLVMAGELIMRLVQEHGTSLIPIDSEHAALFQCLRGVSTEHVKRLTVTGSGGPLWTVPASALGAVTREQVLAHPKWQMGQKITVDSATLMNKGLEVIEARWLFQVPFERLRVVIHPEAMVHAFVELIDGAMLAQLSPCDMRLPIQYALSFPDRWNGPAAQLDPLTLGTLRFFPPDLERFPCLRLASDAAARGTTACAVLNGANDVAVRAYLNGQLEFLDIPRVIAGTLAQHADIPHPSLDDVLRIDAWSRRVADEFVARFDDRDSVPRSSTIQHGATLT